jgi:hypothetical protein
MSREISTFCPTASVDSLRTRGISQTDLTPTRCEIRKNEIASGRPLNDFLQLLRQFYPPNFRGFEENGLFQQPRLITTVSTSPMISSSASVRV